MKTPFDNAGDFDLPEQNPKPETEREQLPAAADAAASETPSALTWRDAKDFSFDDIDGSQPAKPQPPQRSKDPVPEFEAVTPSEVGLREFPSGQFPTVRASKTPLLEYARSSLLDAEQGYFLAGDAINHIRNLPPDFAGGPIHTFRSIAKLLGNWEFSFISKLSVVSAECDAMSRAFAVKHRLGWQACYEACVERRRDGSDEPLIAYLKRRLANRQQPKAKENTASLHATEFMFRRFAASFGKVDQRIGRYGDILYRGARRVVEHRQELRVKEAELRADLEGTLYELHQREDDIMLKAVRSAARLCGGDESFADSDFTALVKFIETHGPDDEFDHGLLQGLGAIRRAARKQPLPGCF